jgi:hypothetical protein
VDIQKSVIVIQSKPPTDASHMELQSIFEACLQSNVPILPAKHDIEYVLLLFGMLMCLP